MSDASQTPAASPAADPIDGLLAQFRAKYPDADVEIGRCSFGAFVCRTPDEGVYSRFMVDNGEPTKRVQAQMALVRACILHPAPEVVDSWFRKKPGLSRPLADLMLTKAGAAEEIALGK